MSEALSRRSERRRRQRAANRGGILAAARRVAENRGPGEISLRGVAAEAGYAPASVYAYFRNRAELVLALAGDDLSQIARALREADDFASAVRAALPLMRGSALAAAAGTLAAGDVPQEAERAFNGKLIMALTALAEAANRAPVKTHEDQADVVLAAAALIGLAALSRTGRLAALGLEGQELFNSFIRRFGELA